MTGRAGGRARIAVCVVALVTGVFTVAGCLLALRLEATGLGRPRDSGVRQSYALALSAGIAAGILAPAALAVWLFPGERRHVITAAVLAVGLGAMLMIAVLGLG